MHGVAVPSYAVGFHIYLRKAGFCFFHDCAVYDVRKWSDTLWPDGRIRLFALNIPSLSSSYRRIWRYWTCLVHCVEYVSKIKSILSIVFHAIYGAVCIRLTRFSYDDCENMCTLFNFHHQIGWSNDPIAIVLVLRHETMVCAVCLSIPLCITGPLWGVQK